MFVTFSLVFAFLFYNCNAEVAELITTSAELSYFFIYYENVHLV